MKDAKTLRQQILDLVIEYQKHESAARPNWQPGGRIPYASRVYDEHEMVNLVDSALEFWLTAGRYAAAFESSFAEYLGLPYALAVNSGSSANLLALSALTSPLLKDKRIFPGDEVITVAAFPTTVAPIVQIGAVPVFVDVMLPNGNIDPALLEGALSGRTKAVMLAHTLGMPFDLQAVWNFCNKHDLWLVEDNCDALGAQAIVDGRLRMTGTVGHIGTSSFFPAHHMTMGEGGAVYTRDALLHKIMLSMRDWGRDCTCPPGHDNTCGCRYDGQFGELPKGYDHKYVYSHMGYNFKITDMQAAVACAQLDKLPGFVTARRAHWEQLRTGVAECAAFLPAEAPEGALISPFGFMMTLRQPDRRESVVRQLEAQGIQTRALFAGNILKHPCFDEMRGSTRYREASGLHVTDRLMNDTFWVGVYPGLTEAQIDYMISCLQQVGK